jgi:hypothetical protein
MSADTPDWGGYLSAQPVDTAPQVVSIATTGADVEIHRPSWAIGVDVEATLPDRSELAITFVGSDRPVRVGLGEREPAAGTVTVALRAGALISDGHLVTSGAHLEVTDRSWFDVDDHHTLTFTVGAAADLAQDLTELCSQAIGEGMPSLPAAASALQQILEAAKVAEARLTGDGDRQMILERLLDAIGSAAATVTA